MVNIKLHYCRLNCKFIIDKSTSTLKYHYFSGWIFVLFCKHFAFAATDSLHVYQLLGNQAKAAAEYQTAITQYDHAIRLADVSRASDSIIAVIHHQSGLCHFFIEDYADAIAHWNKSIHHKQAYLPITHIDIVKPQINVASGYMELRRIDEAREELQKALHLLSSTDQQERYHLSRIYQKLGVVENMDGNPSIAIDYLLQAFRIREALFKDDQSRLTEIAIEIFDVYRTLKQYDQMLFWSDKSLNYVEQYQDKDRRYLTDKAHILNNKGIALTSLHQLDGAEKSIMASLQINQSLNNSEFIGINYSNLIEIYREKSQYEKAINYISKAKAIFSTHYQEYLPELYSIEGDVFRQMNTLDTAIMSYQKGLDKLVVNRTLYSLHINPNVDDVIIGSDRVLLELLYKKAENLFDRYSKKARKADLDLAYAACQRLYALIQKKRQQYSDFELNKFISRQAKLYYSLGINILYEYHLDNPNKQVLDDFIMLNHQSKAALLYNVMAKNMQESSDPLLDRLQRQEQKFVEKKTALEIELWTEDGHSLKPDSLLLATKANLHQVRDSIRQLTIFDSKEYIDLKLDLNSIQESLLQHDELILEYFIGEKEVYLFTISKDGMTVHRIGSTKKLISDVETYLKVVRQYDAKPEVYAPIAFQLYNTLIPKDISPSNRGIKKYRIIADGIIAMIPFEALLTDNVSNNDFRTLDYLLHDYSIAYATSIPVLYVQNQKNQNRGQKKFIGFASDFQRSAEAPNMLEAVTELTSINTLIGGTLLINEAAGKQNFLEKVQDYKMVHLSLHGVADTEQAMSSYIQFDYQDDLALDNRLYANQIYDLHIPASMIVLSACETGLGQVIEGEGVMSIAHAFAYAGAQSIGMSLWQMPVNSTSKLLPEFYNKIVKKHTKSEALHLAKLEYLQDVRASELAHPFYWASMLMYGNQSAINISKSKTRWFLILGAIILGLGFYCNNIKRVS